MSMIINIQVIAAIHSRNIILLLPPSLESKSSAHGEKSTKKSEAEMGAFSIWHWLIVLGVVMLIFGPSRLPSLERDLGKAIRDFKESIQEKNVTPDKTDVAKKTS